MKLSDFDEAVYLSTNPDVEEAARAGRIRSGWHHYIECGLEERRAGVPELLSNYLVEMRDGAEKHPLPPAHLRERVHGSADPKEFSGVGRRAALDLALAFDLSLDSELDLLDFGCGCGRVLRFMRELAPRARIVAVDIDAETIAWCNEQLAGVADFRTIEPEPPIPIPEQRFDLIYGVSVFTHLPEAMQMAWLAELERLLKPAGKLALSLHGPSVARTSLSVLERIRFELFGHVYSKGRGTPGMPSFYQNAFHAPRYLERNWSGHFESIEVIDRGLGDHQDLVVLSS